MKKISKLLCLAITVCLVLSLVLTGCGTKGTGEQGGSDTENSKLTVSENSSAADKTELEPYEVKWYMIGNTSEPDEKMVENAINEYLKDKINTTVDIIAFPAGEEYNNKINTILQSGEKVDLYFTCSWLCNYVDMVTKGFNTEITDEMLDKYAPHAKQVLGSTSFLEGAKVGGKLYDLPCNKEIGAQGGVILNKEMVDKYNVNISAIKKYEDLIPVLQMIKEKEPDSIPIDTCRGSQPSQLIDCKGDFVYQFSHIKMPMNGSKWVVAFDIPEIVDIFRISQKIYKLGLLMGDAVTTTDNMPLLKSGKVFASWQQLKPGKDAEMTTSTGVKWIQVPLTDTVTRSADPTGSMMAIPKTCKDPSRVLMFYDYFYCDKYLVTTINHGIENTHWVKIDENTIGYAPATENGSKSGWNPPFNTWTVGDQFLNYIFEGEDPDKYANLKAFNTSCKPFPSVGFIFDPSNCKNICDKLYAAQADEYTLLILGIVDDVDATMKLQLDKWNAAGLQDVLAEYNKQYEAWLKTK